MNLLTGMSVDPTAGVSIPTAPTVASFKVSRFATIFL